MVRAILLDDALSMEASTSYLNQSLVINSIYIYHIKFITLHITLSAEGKTKTDILTVYHV